MNCLSALVAKHVCFKLHLNLGDNNAAFSKLQYYQRLVALLAHW